jgi:S1-C subfamily serine protease
MAGSVGPGERIREGTHVSQILRLDSHIWRWTVALPLLLATLIWAGSAHARAAPDSFADLVEKLLPVVVNISTIQVVESYSSGEGRLF